MAKIQEKLKETVENKEMKSLDRIAGILHTSQAEEMDTNNDGPVVAVDALETIKDFKGENKAPIKRTSKRRKHSLKTKAPAKEKEDKPKRRPKYFVQF